MGNTVEPVHVKIIHDNQTRRFIFSGTEFTSLKETITRLLKIDDEFVLKYQDDENDYVTLECQEDLVTALSISPKLLRISIDKKTISPPISSNDPHTLPIHNAPPSFEFNDTITFNKKNDSPLILSNDPHTLPIHNVSPSFEFNDTITLNQKNDSPPILSNDPHPLPIHNVSPCFEFGDTIVQENDSPSVYSSDIKFRKRRDRHHHHHEDKNPERRKQRVEKKLAFIQQCLADLADEAKLMPRDLAKKQRLLKKQQKLETFLTEGNFVKTEKKILTPEEEQLNGVVKLQIIEIKEEIGKLKARKRELKMVLKNTPSDKELLDQLANLKDREGELKIQKKSLWDQLHS
jgi:hypothetical protein